jgi:transcription initiation factor IIE alpha subunit
MNCQMLRLAKAANYCCIYEMYRANDLISGTEMANRLGVSERTVRRWARKIYDGELTPCGRCPTPHSRRRPLKRPAGV